MSNVFKNRDHDHTLNTSKEKYWFEIKDNIKIESYNLNFFNCGKNQFFFPFLYNYHEKLNHAIFYH